MIFLLYPIFTPGGHRPDAPRRAVANCLVAASGGGKEGTSEDPSRCGKGLSPSALPSSMCRLPDRATALMLLVTW